MRIADARLPRGIDAAELAALERAATAIHDAHGRLQFVSDAFEALVGWPCGERIGQRPPHPWWPSCDPNDASPLMGLIFSGAAARAQVFGFRSQLIRHDGSSVDVVFVYHPLYVAGALVAHANEVIRAGEVEALAATGLIERVRLAHRTLGQALREAEACRVRSPDRGADRARGVESLSRRQREILLALLDGRRADEIARSLFISRHTARSHIKSIFRKLGVRSQVELLREFGSPLHE